jgi:ribosome-associated translation inhibitor RaiA
MPFSDKSHNLRIELDTKNCSLSAAEIEKMEQMLDPLREPARSFPVSDLYITVTYHPRSLDYHVRTSLVLTGRTLFTGQYDENPVSAFGQCVRKLVHRITAYKDSLEAKPEQSKAREGTAQEVVPTQEPDAEELQSAVAGGDYAAFREAMYVYEESVRKRAGRWIQRYPEFEALLGDEFALDDLVEEVMLNAFDQFNDKPKELRLGQWLEELIDPSVKALLQNPEAERENIAAVRSWRDQAEEEQAGE